MTFLHKLAKRLALIPAASVYALCLLASCTEGSPQEYLGPDPTKPNHSVTYLGLNILPRDPQIVEGDSVRLAARGWLPSGLSTTAQVTWSASGGTMAESGWFKATTAGPYRIRAVSVANPALSDSVLITVIPGGGVARLDITPSAPHLPAGTQQQFTAVALMGDGSRTYPTVTWAATGGTISTSGLFTASGAPGGYTVTASMGGGAFLGATAGVIDAAVLTGLEIEPAALTMESGSVRQLVPRASWSDGSTSIPPLSWTATGGSVTSSGSYTAGTTAGSYRVIVSSLGKADTSTVTILPRITGMRVVPLTALLAFEATQALTAYAQRSDGTEGPAVVAWSAEGGSITPGGLYTAGSIAGTYAIVGSLTAPDGSVFRDTANFEVDADGATIVQVFVRPDTSILAGSTVQFSASGTLAGGGSAVPAMLWSATGGSIDSKGLYTAGSVPGNYTVIGRKKIGNKADTANVVVRAASVPTISGFTISPQTDILGAGQSRQFSATLIWSDAGVHPADISWVSAGGTITQNGLYTAGTVAGTFLVIATCGCGAADTAAVTIPQASAPAVTLSQLVMSPATVELDPGAGQNFTVTGVWSDGATSPPAVSYVATGGTITPAGVYAAGSAPGAYQVIATQMGGGLADTSIVTIKQGAVTLTQLVLNPSAVTVPKGANQAFVVSASWSDGSTTVPPVTFTATGGTVSADGVFSAGTTAGTFRLIAAHTGGTRADTSVITVSAATLNQVMLNPGTVSLVPGGTQQFVVSGSWSDGSSLAPAVTWTVGGGSITPAGLYTSGSVSGTYQVIARHSSGTKADTSAVTISAAAPPLPGGANAPELPRVWLNTSYTAPTGPVINVPAGGDFQAALNSAACGNSIILAAGATYTGNFVLPARQCAGNKIHIRTAGTLPPEGVRVTPASAVNFAKIVTSNPSAAIEAAVGARGYWIIGVEVSATHGVGYNYGLVTIGSSYESLANMPGDVFLDRVYIHGIGTLHLKRCVALNGVSTAVVDSYLSECHADGFDSQGIAGWSGAGPYKIVNNHIEGAAQNVIFGGAPTGYAGSPSDIEIRRNYMPKPISWLGSPMSWNVKNSLELKNGVRVLIEGNIFQNNWADAQSGFAILFMPLNDGAGATAAPATVRDVTFRLNRVISSGSGINIVAASGYPQFGDGPTLPLSRLLVENNVFEDIGRADLKSEGKMVQILGGVRGVTINHNTFLHSQAPGALMNSAIILAAAPDLMDPLIITNNVFSGGIYGVTGDNAGIGTSALTAHALNWQFVANAVTGQNVYPYGPYPDGNYFPATVADLGLDSQKRLGAASGLLGKGTDGRDLGVDVNALLAALAGVTP